MPAESIHAFNTATWSLTNSFLVQLTSPDEAYDAVCPFYLVDHPEGIALVDTGISHDLLDDPANYGSGAAFMEGFLPAIDYDESMHPVAHLESTGYGPEDVDYVVVSHLHSDHAGHLDGDFGMLRSADFDVTVVGGEYDVFGDGSVLLVPTPGHTPGHQSVVVDLPSGTVVLGIDVAHQQDGLEREHLASFNTDLSQSIASLREIKARARREDAELYVLHDNDHIGAFDGGMN